MTLLGEMPCLNGDVSLNGRVFYVSQEPWIFSSTIRQNIIFGKDYEKNKFDKIIDVCCLENVIIFLTIYLILIYYNLKYPLIIATPALNSLLKDLKLLKCGDLTYIGDKGVNLSGGQRARISLARALYDDAEIYLLDDPLSAVDESVAKLLYTKYD